MISIKKFLKYIKNKFSKLNDAKDSTFRDFPNKVRRNIFKTSTLSNTEVVIKKRFLLPIGRKVKKPFKSNCSKLDESLKKQWDSSKFLVEPEIGKSRFHDFGIPDKVMHAISDMGFEFCTPIQAEILASILCGRDAFGRAKTGTGKTAAFLITILSRFIKNTLSKKSQRATPRALVIVPTRELVLQIAAEARRLSSYCNFSIVSVFGGMEYARQKRQINNRPVDIVVATPGRLLDFRRRNDINLKRVEIVVIDEADRMLNMGFISDIRKILYNVPHKSKRQTLFFSATLASEVTKLASAWTVDPLNVTVEPDKIAVDTVRQIIYTVTARNKITLIYNIIMGDNLKKVIIFCNRRDETRSLSYMLKQFSIDCKILSGEIPQNKRIKTLNDFKAGKIRVLVATDVAGRGIHVDGVKYVINFTLPRDPEDYVHRIGRTGRAGTKGTSISFACENDSFYVPIIENFIGEKLVCVQPPFKLLLPPIKVINHRRSQKSKKTFKKKHHNKGTKFVTDRGSCKNENINDITNSSLVLKK